MSSPILNIAGAGAVSVIICRLSASLLRRLILTMRQESPFRLMAANQKRKKLDYPYPRLRRRERNEWRSTVGLQQRMAQIDV